MDKETIVQLLSDGVISNEVAAKYFPELKEIEDEKVKEELIKAINLAYDCGIAITKENRDKYLAWIEKQGEQKPALPKWKYKKDNAPLLRDSIILNKYGCVAKSPSGAIVSDVWVIDYDELAKLPKEEFEKQDEPNVCEGCNNVKGCLACVDGSEWAHIEESKSFWSEEDETAIHLACEFIRHHFRKGDSINGTDCTELVKMLWSIKERMQAQHQQEWSEDDEIRHKTTLDDLEAFLEYIQQKPSREISEYSLMSKDSILATIQKDIDWFRTLKDRMQPQVTWKPSKEQMGSLANACDGKILNLDYLNSLYQDLKKLKEE